VLLAPQWSRPGMTRFAAEPHFIEEWLPRHRDPWHWKHSPAIKIDKKDGWHNVRTNPFLAVLPARCDAGLDGESRHIDSGSYDKAGVDRSEKSSRDFFKSHSVEVERLPRDVAGDIFRAIPDRAMRPSC